jgi:hypothetical protein
MTNFRELNKLDYVRRHNQSLEENLNRAFALLKVCGFYYSENLDILWILNFFLKVL